MSTLIDNLASKLGIDKAVLAAALQAVSPTTNQPEVQQPAKTKNPINPLTGKPYRGRQPVGGWPTNAPVKAPVVAMAAAKPIVVPANVTDVIPVNTAGYVQSGFDFGAYMDAQAVKASAWAARQGETAVQLIMTPTKKGYRVVKFYRLGTRIGKADTHLATCYANGKVAKTSAYDLQKTA